MFWTLLPLLACKDGTSDPPIQDSGTEDSGTEDSESDTGTRTEPEDCFDGVDNDADGLLDCEDGDCAEACSETECSDTLDNDGDGFADCLDDDCLDSANCLPSKQVWIDSAHMHRESKERVVRTTYPYSTFNSSAVLTGVEGRILQAAGSGHLSTTSSVLSCEFHIDTWSFAGSGAHEWSGFLWVSPGEPIVSGLTVSPPCEGLPSSQFLPHYERPGLSSEQIRWGLWGNQLGYLQQTSGSSGYTFKGSDWLTGSELISKSSGSGITRAVYSGEVVGVAPFNWEPPLNP